MPEQLVILRQCYVECCSSFSTRAVTPNKQIFHAGDIRKSILKMQVGLMLKYETATVNRGDFERRGDFEHFTKISFVFS